MLLTPEYKQVLMDSHAGDAEWGSSGGKYAEYVRELLSRYNAKAWIDYGCGKGILADRVEGCTRYDPGIPGIDDPIVLLRTFDVVVSTDVMEHVEPDCVDDTIKLLRHMTGKGGFHAISLIKDAFRLTDGRISHLCVQPADWWIDKFQTHGFRVKEIFLDQNKPRYREVCLTIEVEPHGP